MSLIGCHTCAHGWHCRSPLGIPFDPLREVSPRSTPIRYNAAMSGHDARSMWQPLRRWVTLAATLFALFAIGCDQLYDAVTDTADGFLSAIEMVAYLVFGGGVAMELGLLLLIAIALWQGQPRRLLIAAAALGCGVVHVRLATLFIAEIISRRDGIPLQESLFAYALIIPAASTVLIASGMLLTRIPALSRTPKQVSVLAFALAFLACLATGSLITAQLIKGIPPGIPSGSVVESISSSDTHHCALTAKGTVLCWGNNRKGQLGNGRRRKRMMPASEVVTLDKASAVVTGEHFSCALRSSQVLCWGDNPRGMFGADFPTESDLPKAIGETDATIEIVARDNRLWMRTESGRIIQMPSHELLFGQAEKGEPDVVPLDTIQFAPGNTFWCALRSSGSLVCRPYGSSFERIHPPFVPKTSTLRSIVALPEVVCGLQANGQVVCGNPQSIHKARAERIRVCQLPYLVRAMAKRHMAQRENSEAESVPMPALGDNCEEELENAQGAAAAPTLTVLPGITDATAITVSDDVLCVSSLGQGVRCGAGARSVKLPELTESLPVLPNHPVPVFSNKTLSCVHPTPAKLFCWKGAVGKSEAQILKHLNVGS